MAITDKISFYYNIIIRGRVDEETAEKEGGSEEEWRGGRKGDGGRMDDKRV